MKVMTDGPGEDVAHRHWLTGITRLTEMDVVHSSASDESNRNANQKPISPENKYKDEFEELFYSMLQARFYTVLLGGIVLLCFNYIIIFILFILSEIQIYAWKNKFKNSSDASLQDQKIYMDISGLLCVVITILIAIIHIIWTVGARNAIKIVAASASLSCRFAHFIGALIMILLFRFMILPSEKVQHSVQTLFRDNYSSSTTPHAVICLQCSTVICNLQVILSMFWVNKYKDPDNDLDLWEESTTPPSSDADERDDKIRVGTADDFVLL